MEGRYACDAPRGCGCSRGLGLLPSHPAPKEGFATCFPSSVWTNLPEARTSSWGEGEGQQSAVCPTVHRRTATWAAFIPTGKQMWWFMVSRPYKEVSAISKAAPKTARTSPLGETDEISLALSGQTSLKAPQITTKETMTVTHLCKRFILHRFH